MDDLTKRVKSAYRNKIRGGRTSSASSKATRSNQDLFKNQISNYETRLQNAGVDPKKAKDTRNPIEKFLNLKQDQNVLFDIFELIGRPQQALFGAIDSAQKGKDVGKGALQGLTGKKTTSGGQLLRNAGMKGNDKANLFTKEGRKNIHLSDVLGFGLDLFADPIDLAAAPVKVTSTAGKAVRAADNIADVAKGSKGLKLVKTADKVGDTAKGITAAKAGLNTLGDVGKVAKTEWKPLSSALLSYAGKGIKKGAKVSDNILEKALSKSDAKSLRKAEEYVAKNGGDIENALREMGRSSSKLDIYKGLKNQLSRTVDSSKNLMGLTRKSREAQNIADLNKSIGERTIKNLNEDLDKISNNFAELGFNSKEEASKAISNALQTHIERNWDYSIKGKDVLDSLKKNTPVDFFNEDSAKQIVDELKNYGIKASNDGRNVILLDNKSKLKNLTDVFSDKTFGEYLSKQDLVDRNTASELLNRTPELQALASKSESTFPNLARTSDDLTGLQSSNIAREGYVRHGLSDEGVIAKQGQGQFPSRNKAFNERQFKGTTAEYNRLRNENLLEKTDKVAKKKENAMKSIYKTNDAGEFVTDANGKFIRDDVQYNTLVQKKQDKITKLNNELESSKELLKGRTEGLNAIDETKLTAKDAKSLKTLRAEKQFQETTDTLKKLKFDGITPEASETIDNLRSSFKDFRKSKNQYVNALKKKNITDDEIKALKNTMDKNQKIVTTNINAAKQFQNKQARQIVGNANKAFREGKKTGVLLEKESRKLATAQARVTEIYNAATDLADSIPKQLKYEQAALNKIENSADAIFNAKSKLIEQQAKAANILTSQEGIEFMNTGFMENLTDYVNRSSNFNKGAQLYNEALTTGIFKNRKYVREITDASEKIPFGYTKVDGSLLANNIKNYQGILPEGSKDLVRIADDFKGKTLAVDKELANMLNLTKRTNEAVNPLLKFFDSVNNTFKKFSTLTLGFQERNIIGNSTNMVLSGANAKELPEYYKKAADLWNKWNKTEVLKDKLISGATLTQAERKELDIMTDFIKGGFLDAFEKGQGMEALKAGKGVLGKASKASVNMNQTMDTWNRLTLLMYAKDHPEYVKKLGRKDAVEAVKMVLFDPDNMSDLERNVFKKIIPFYTFTKQNLMFQAENVMKNTPRYNKLFKALNKAYDSVGEDKYYQYQKDAMQIPIPFTDGKGNQLFLKSNLPVSDLGEFIGDPLGRLAASTSPVIKTPYELKSGKSMFTGEDINYKTLSNTLNKLGVRDQGIENAAQAAETILNNFGLQNVSTNLISKVSSILDRNNDDKSNQQLWAEIFKSVLQNTKQESVENVKLYNELEQYQSILRRLKQQGVEVPTMTEINKMKLNRFKNKRASLR